MISTLLLAAGIAVGPFLTVTPNGAVNTGLPIVVANHDETQVTNSLSLSTGGKSVSFGIDSGSGGIPSQITVAGFTGDGAFENTNLNVVGCGRSWQFAIFDTNHNLYYNPTQGGIKRQTCVPTTVTALSSTVGGAGGLRVNQYNMPLFCNPLNDFTKYQDITEDCTTADGANSDSDGIDDAAVYGCAQEDCELRPEFDATVADLDRTPYFVTSGGAHVPTIQVDSAIALIRPPRALLQFGASALDVNSAAVYNHQRDVQDISKVMSGSQATTAVDLGSILEQYGFRIGLSQFTQFLWQDSTGTWQSEAVPGTVPSNMNCEELGSRDDYWRYVDGSKLYQNSFTTCGDFKNHVFMISTGTSPDTSFAVGLYRPTDGCDSSLNTSQVWSIDWSGNIIKEDRHAQYFMRTGVETDPTYGNAIYPKLTWFTRISGIQSLFGWSIITSRHFLLFGTPNEIMSAVTNWRAACHTGDEAL